MEDFEVYSEMSQFVLEEQPRKVGKMKHTDKFIHKLLFFILVFNICLCIQDASIQLLTLNVLAIESNGTILSGHGEMIVSTL